MTEQQIEKAAEEYAKQTKAHLFGDEKLVKSNFIAGVTFALSHQWVSVEERLPEDDRYFYLVADARLNPMGVDCAEYTCETKLFSRNGAVLHPTHWCPIPHLNNEKEEA